MIYFLKLYYKVFFFYKIIKNSSINLFQLFSLYFSKSFLTDNLSLDLLLLLEFF
jgi:hypothetical protein